MIHVFIPTVRYKGQIIANEIQKELKERAMVVVDSESGGYWAALNRLITTYKPVIFIWLADDCELHKGWFDELNKCWELNFEHNLGLIACNDLNILDAGAPFGMTSIHWLFVLFGKREFPGIFNHYFLDTLLADRSKDLGRYIFCKQSIVEHKHYSIGKNKYDEIYENNLKFKKDDKIAKDFFDKEWSDGEIVEAQKRMQYEIDRYEWYFNS